MVYLRMVHFIIFTVRDVRGSSGVEDGVTDDGIDDLVCIYHLLTISIASGAKSCMMHCIKNDRSAFFGYSSIEINVYLDDILQV